MTPARGWLAVAGGVVLYLLLEAGLFRTGLYQAFLAPDSYAGNFEFVVEAERTRPVSHPRQILAIGDSRMALRAWHANARQSELTFGNAGIASSTPRVWHYALKAIDPARDRYEAILFLVEDYDDEDVAEDYSRRLLDVQLMVARIGLADIPELLFSYPEWTEQSEVLRKVILKGFTYQRDLQEFLKNPRQRLADREFKRQQWARVLGSYRGEDRTLAGLHIDWQTRKATYPDSLSARERQLIDDVLLRPAETQTGRMGAYRREWFGRILQRYQGTRTRILFARVPRGPIPRPASLVQKRSAVLRQLPGVTLLDENLLNELEHPDFFIDPLHLNAEGCRRLTDILTRAVRDALDARLVLFNSAQFALFLAVLLPAFYLSPLPARKPLLLLASYAFYMAWNPRFLVLLLALTVVDYLAALWMDRAEGAARKAALAASLAANLGMLAYFKYFGFFTGIATDIILPLGISFHTFQSISYVVDVYRREQAPVRSLLDYALFIAFFPQLVAGPIVRAHEFFVDLNPWRPPTAMAVRRGALLLVFGLVKKMVAADHFALAADAYFQNPSAHPGLLPAWGGLLAFAFQIFFDFSGYTDTAIGCAALFGFHFPDNFRRPYLAASITEFWRRWHMSLSRWLRDYLYIPLGGNRHGPWRTYRNLMLTMLLGGLWHGASWNFVLWGGYHGALLSAERLFGPAERKGPLRVLLTFFLVCLGWVFFRAATFADATWILGQLFSATPGKFGLTQWEARLAVFTALLALAEERWQWFDALTRQPAWRYAAALALLLLTLEMFGVTGANIPFIYFQF